ncbi:unnamed protein product [Schistosoma mattheei]|uniref:Uncharacterized protein n=1 Tax=Schistosoma mattheei TaxID=31246 RepID=A0A183PYC8_9TREM|nr:unnamed protein product [Schistosoma mattheei]
MQKTTSVAASSAAVGLNIHKGKSKILRHNTACTNRIALDGEALGDVKTFTYLGGIIDERSGSDADVKPSTVYWGGNLENYESHHPEDTSVCQQLSTQNTSDSLAIHHQQQSTMGGNKPDSSGGRNQEDALEVVSVFTGLTILLLVAAPFIMVAVPCIICAKCHRLYRQHRLRKRHSQGLYMVNGRVLNTPISSNVQNDRTDTPQPTSSTPHHSIFIPSCRSSIVSVDHRPTVEQKADIHWSPWQNEFKCTSTRKVMHRSKSVPAYCCTVPLNSLLMTSHTP